MSNRLECQVRSCQHYSDNLCGLNGIRVEGPGARVGSQTCCGSFEERQAGSVQNAVSGQASPETAITCAAEHCAYNDDRRCRAERVYVDVGAGTANSRSGTECRTFRPA